MIKKAVARRYALALFSAYEKEGKYLQCLQEVTRFLEMLDKEDALKRAIFLPLIEMEKRKEILRDLVRLLNISFVLSNLLLLLMENNRMHLLPEIKEEYIKIVDEREGRLRGTLFTAFPITQKEKEEIERILKEKMKKEVILEVKEDKTLIGGLKLKIRDILIDGSVKRQLELLEEKLLKE